MPEGPEVTIIREGLHKLLKGKYIHSIKIGDGSRYRNKAPDLMNTFLETTPSKIIKIDSKGKLIFWELENGYYMLNTLGMSGIWSSEKKKHISLQIHYGKKNDKESQQKILYFADQRHFGTVKFIQGEAELNKKLKTIGPDMLNDKDMSFEVFEKRMRKQDKKNITVALMNQKVVSGIGNYLKSESLYHAKISPLLKVEDLSKERLKLLYQACRLKIVASYNQGGASLRDYMDIDDKEGQYHFTFQVYGQKKTPEGLKVEHIQTNDKRGTFWVPEVQN